MKKRNVLCVVFSFIMLFASIQSFASTDIPSTRSYKVLRINPTMGVVSVEPADINGTSQVICNKYNSLYFRPDTEVTLKAGSGFSAWNGDITGNTNPAKIVMDCDKSIIAEISDPGPVRELKIVTNFNGGTSFEPADINGISRVGSNATTILYYPNNTLVRMSAWTDVLLDWSGDVDGYEKTQRLLMDSDKNVDLFIGCSGIGDGGPKPKDFSIWGDVSPEVISDKTEIYKGFEIEIIGLNKSIVTTRDNSSFDITEIPYSFYDTDLKLKISKPGYLQRIYSVNTLNKSVDKHISLWPGDLDQNNSINIADIILIAQNFNSAEGDENYNIYYDFNLDGAINISDILCVAKHFNTTTDSYQE